MNFLIAGYGYTEGVVPFGASLPITNAQLRTSNSVLGYARVLDLWGQSGRFDLIVPYTWLSGTADFAAHPAARPTFSSGQTPMTDPGSEGSSCP